MEIFFKDKQRIFECKILIEGANIEDATARLILEFDDQTLLFKGKIDENGKCSFQIPKLKNLTSLKGTASLEVVAESTLFEPWSSEFIVKESKSVKVEMINHDNIDPEIQKTNEKVKIKVNVVEPKQDIKQPEQILIKESVTIETEPIVEQPTVENEPVIETKSIVEETKKEEINETVEKETTVIKNISESEESEIPDFETFKALRKQGKI